MLELKGLLCSSPFKLGVEEGGNVVKGQRPALEEVPVSEDFGAEHREHLCAIMQACWTEDADERESAAGAASRIEALLA
ncbi:phl [Symbiodinium natans]|uniref:Phl protein n=1 Tax=Symbiodinium natans TaxID=878477 RepID=A0A812TZP1_9DINO|nr:phl [Symbiodinium natans]